MIKNKKQYNWVLILLVYASIILPSCKSTKLIKEEESLIKEVKIEIDDKSNKVDKETMATELGYLVRQNKNGKFFFIPREYIYLKNSEPKDTSGYHNWVRNRLGQAPSIFDEKATSESTKAIEQYLRLKKGYYKASVSNKVETKNQKTSVTYNVSLGDRYTINSIEYFSKDENLLRKVKEIKDGSAIKVGRPIDFDDFEQEKSRLVGHLQNEGYTDFAANYISINGDSTKQIQKIDIIIEFQNPSQKKSHTVYRVGEIRVFTDHYHKQDTSDLYSEVYNGVEYLREQSTFIISPKVIDEAIKFAKGNLTKREDRLETYNNLSLLGAYRFSEIIARKNKKDSTIIDYDIQLTPHNSKWTQDSGLDIFSSTITKTNTTQQNINLLGLGVSTNWENRNLFGGSERLSANASASSQIELGKTSDIFRVLNLGVTSSIQYPNFKDPLRIIRSLNKVYLATDNIYRIFEQNATTSLFGGANSINYREQYSIRSVNLGLGYKFTDGISRNIILNQIGIAYNNYNLDTNFINTIIGNPLITKNFEDNIITGVVFRDINFSYNKQRNKNGWAKSFNTNFEISGLEASILNGIYNLITNTNKEFKIGGLALSKYVRFEFDGRLTKFFKGKKSIVGRFNFGIIAPWKKTQSAPFIKQFNVGGPNSLRAWPARSLGPGEFTYPTTTIPYSQGDLKLEGNLEYRFNIWWKMQGALFLDAGNVWALQGFSSGQGALFSPSFYDQIAIASGWGMRWDFDYFLIRFDFGYRIRDPFPTLGKHWYKPQAILDQKIGNIQVAINHPF